MKKGVIGLASILGACALDILIVRYLFGINYLTWFLNNGSTIALGFGVISAVWEDLNVDVALISAYPPRFIDGCQWFAKACWKTTGHTANAVGALTRESDGRSLLRAWALIGQALIMLILVLLISLVVTLWCVAVAPFLYFVHLIAGAPARAASSARANRVVIASDPDGDLRLMALPFGAAVPKAEDGWRYIEVSFTKRPVTMTSALAAGLLWLARQGLR